MKVMVVANLRGRARSVVRCNLFSRKCKDQKIREELNTAESMRVVVKTALCERIADKTNKDFELEKKTQMH